ncbi:MAG: aminoglycoside phosphotransferase family protein [Clostridia bacterium]|nr:aminoglycoside phosphotransferase family protein [Clostridia bacterium]
MTFKKFFVPNENFKNMIKQALPGKKIEKLDLISTGWTNIVYEAKTKDGESFFFRFPRDNFWGRTIVKDCQFAKYIQGKTTYHTANLKLLENDERNFSMHQKVEGQALTDKMDKLNKEQIDQLSYEIADFMYQLHSMNYKKEEIFSCDNIGLDLVDFLDELIGLHLDASSRRFWNYNEFKHKDNSCLVHGDFNPGNIIIDENNHIAAVIDFGFAGFGNKYFDISRIIGRLPADYKEPIIRHYEEISGQKLDYDMLETETKVWSDIDNGYIKYMKGIGIYK